MWLTITIAALVVVPVVVGYLMPVRYEGHTVVRLDKSVHEVWEALQDVEAHPMTGKMMKSVETLPPVDGLPAWQEDMGHGEIITVSTTELEADRRLVREMAAKAVNMKSRWVYVLEPDGEGCKVTVTGVTDIEKGTWHTPLFRVLMVLGGGVRKGLDTQLDMVATTLGVEAERSG